jgi:hypothetical protein
MPLQVPPNRSRGTQPLASKLLKGAGAEPGRGGGVLGAKQRRSSLPWEHWSALSGSLVAVVGGGAVGGGVIVDVGGPVGVAALLVVGGAVVTVST